MKIQKEYLSKVFFSLFAAVVMFTACTEDEQIELIQENTKYAQVTTDGVLKFNDFTDFNALLEDFKDDEKFKKDFFASKSSFKSLWNLYENLSEEDELEIMSNPDAYKHMINFQEIDGEVYAEFILDDSDLGSLLNQNGELIIGDNLYKINADYAEVFPLNEDAKSARSTSELIPISRNTLLQDGNGMGNNRERVCREDYEHRETRWRKKAKRFKGSLWTLHIGSIYSGIGVSTTHYRRNAGIWWRDKTQQLRLKYDVTFTQYVAGTSITDSDDWDSGIKTNERRVSTVFERCVNTDCTWMFESADSYHYGKVDNGNVYSCNLNI